MGRSWCRWLEVGCHSGEWQRQSHLLWVSRRVGSPLRAMAGTIGPPRWPWWSLLVLWHSGTCRISNLWCEPQARLAQAEWSRSRFLKIWSFLSKSRLLKIEDLANLESCHSLWPTDQRQPYFGARLTCRISGPATELDSAFKRMSQVVHRYFKICEALIFEDHIVFERLPLRRKVL